MNIAKPFIHRPVATTLLTVAVALAGAVAFRGLPVAPLPQVDFPTITVTATMPGASPETMASAIATPLERQFGRIAGITEMTSASYLGVATVTLQFDLNRNIDAPRVMSRLRSMRRAVICPRISRRIPPIARSIRQIRRCSSWR